jgi:hypothetical protein
MRKIVPYELNVPLSTSSLQTRANSDYSILQEIESEPRTVIRLTQILRQDS